MQNLEENKKNAIAYYRTAYEGSPREAVEKYVGAEYIQHNPNVGNGKQPFIEYFERMAKEYPNKSIHFVRSIAEGDLVALHTHQVWPDGDEYVTMDIFRFDENGKIVEHWDAVQEIPKESANAQYHVLIFNRVEFEFNIVNFYRGSSLRVVSFTSSVTIGATNCG